MSRTGFYFTIIFIAFSFYFHTAKADAPTGRDLLTACQSSLAEGFNSIEGMLCTWYVTPCDCVHNSEDIPRVCLPANLTEEYLARLLIDELKSSKNLLSQNAELAANSILVNYYPCIEKF